MRVSPGVALWAALLVIFLPGAVAAQPAQDSTAHRAGWQAAPVSTATTLTASPVSGTSATVFHVSASVSPMPDAGQVRFTAWTVDVGGSIAWDHTFALGGDGQVAVPGGLNIDPGTYWWQAAYLGDPSFSASSSDRKKITVSGVATSLTDVSLDWQPASIGFSGTGRAADGSLNAHGGAIELLVDGEVHATCKQWSTHPASCTVLNNLPPGPHYAAVRYRPENVKYGSATSPLYNVTNGPALPPTSGILIEAGRGTINHLDVNINVAANLLVDSALTEPVVELLLSNSASVDAHGLLSGGTLVPYGASVPWELSAGSDGMRTVFAQLHTADAWSPVFSATTTLDTTPPSGSVVINNGDEFVGDPWSGSLPEQTLSGSAFDAGAPAPLLRMAFSNDGKRWRYSPFSGIGGAYSTDWMISDNTFGGYAADNGFYPGMKTVYAKWQDAAGNWSAVTSDTIDYADWTSIVTVLIDGTVERDVYSPTYKSSPDVTVTVTVNIPPSAPDALKEVHFFGNDDESACAVAAWPDGASSVSIPWSLVASSCGYTSKDGVKNLSAELITTAGAHYDVGGGIVILDRVVPTSNAPLPAFGLDHTVTEVAGNGLLAGATTTTATTTITWKGADKNPISEYDLQQKSGSAWQGVPLADASKLSTDQVVSVGDLTQYRVKATDVAGNSGSWKTGPSYTMAVIDGSDSRVKYSGTWRTDTNGDALGATLRSTGSNGASATIKVNGRAFAWVAPRSGGNAAVYVDGKLIKTVVLGGSNEPLAWSSASPGRTPASTPSRSSRSSSPTALPSTRSWSCPSSSAWPMGRLMRSTMSLRAQGPGHGTVGR